MRADKNRPGEKSQKTLEERDKWEEKKDVVEKRAKSEQKEENRLGERLENIQLRFGVKSKCRRGDKTRRVRHW